MATQEPQMVGHREPDTIFEQDSKSNPLLQSTRRCCFCFPCFSCRRSSPVGFAWWDRTSSPSSQSPRTHGDGGHHRPRRQCWARGIRALKKIREWSEIAAGPRWKTFIRRFNRNNNNRGSSAGNNRQQHGKFQYDPLSYALNFDEGHGQIAFDEDYCDDDYGGFRDFSSRYASVSGRPLAMDALNQTDVAVKA